nr:MAG TPA: hypothetical protein [Caudoviricetes sp.]
MFRSFKFYNIFKNWSEKSMIIFYLIRFCNFNLYWFIIFIYVYSFRFTSMWYNIHINIICSEGRNKFIYF